MVFIKSSIAAIALASAGVAQATNVGCFVDGSQVAVVDLETGNCPFEIPSEYPTTFEYKSEDDYDAEFYYVKDFNNVKRYTDIANAGRVIEVPAAEAYNKGALPAFHVHAQKTPASNSSALIRKRLMLEEVSIKRDATSDFVESLKSETGESFDVTLEVKDPVDSSSASTATDKATTVVTITSCSEDKCTEVPVTTGLTTVTEEFTTYTTYCPLTDDSIVTKTELSTTVVTITSCSDNKCTEVPVTTGVTTVADESTTYTTYCPLSSEAPVKTITITSCSDDVCHETAVPATPTTIVSSEDSIVTTLTTYVPITVAPASTSEASTAASVSTFNNAGASTKATLLSLLVVPLAYFL